MNQLRIGGLFEGYGGLTMAVQAVLGGELVWYSEVDPRPVKVLAHHHPGVPNLGDITAIDWTQVEPVDVLAGGFPCQDISNAGRQAGIEGERSGLWKRMVDAIRILRPGLVFIENVAAIAVRGLDVVLADLAAVGFDAEWTMLRAADVGDAHRRERLFIIAWPATDAPDFGHEWRGGARRGRTGIADGCHGSVADAASVRRGEGRTEPAGLERGSDAPLGGNGPSSHPAGDGLLRHDGRPSRESSCSGGERHLAGGDRVRTAAVQWGSYEPAIRRWEQLTRQAPAPWQISPKTGNRQLSARFTEWLMGLPDGYVTDHLSRNHALHVLGNGVVPQQGAAALRLLLDRVRLERAA